MLELEAEKEKGPRSNPMSSETVKVSETVLVPEAVMVAEIVVPAWQLRLAIRNEN